jgi:hypothetical protein
VTQLLNLVLHRTNLCLLLENRTVSPENLILICSNQCGSFTDALVLGLELLFPLHFLGLQFDHGRTDLLINAFQLGDAVRICICLFSNPLKALFDH